MRILVAPLQRLRRNRVDLKVNAIEALQNVGNCRVVIHGAARLEFEGGRVVNLGPETDEPRE
jgi:hypothetical protein